ncbi:hypothetical protein MNV_1220004 [Candidatus Methanoperedens nitroreducens]|uniref:Uncharacterized protein n=1 Tax=Candidatus Methanoperedens nitratireducens TaxID=1392998 RepID=A0A284VJV5_9EURY|nr:hypothetical protein MNV_1220004 [Candidatus Methanoperedens nitroreducens]
MLREQNTTRRYKMESTWRNENIEFSFTDRKSYLDTRENFV